MAKVGSHAYTVWKSNSQTGAGNNETLKTALSGKGVGVIYYAPGAARTGLILEDGRENGQHVTVTNTATNVAHTITFAAQATSKVAGGASIVIGASQSLLFTWSATLSLWVPGKSLVTGANGYFTVAKDTNGTSAVNVIAATVPFACTITGVYVVALDATAGNITVTDTAGSVVVIAKGTTAGALVGGTTLTNTTVSSGDILTIVSSSAGNARVFITFTTVM